MSCFFFLSTLYISGIYFGFAHAHKSPSGKTGKVDIEIKYTYYIYLSGDFILSVIKKEGLSCVDFITPGSRVFGIRKISVRRKTYLEVGNFIIEYSTFK